MSRPKAKQLNFLLNVPGPDMERVVERFMPNGRYVLNRTMWRGKEPRSCAVTSVNARLERDGWEWRIEVSYRPKGYVSYLGNTRYDGWTAMVPDRSTDPPKMVPREVFTDTDFNELDFGEFVGEVELDGVKRVPVDSIMQELQSSGAFGASIHGSFMAPHRSRPNRKVILSSRPTGLAVDGFGTHILNVNNATPGLGQVLMEQLATLMCDFIEGKAGLKSIGNDNLCFVDLSDALVDCTPNESGQESRFNILHLYTPDGFLEDLATRLMSIYAIEVSIADGERGGLVLRRETEKK